MIDIMKASAGSGKTWNLARQYIRLLLEKKDPYAYRHILAVTFTNKATDEMKERILTELHRLSSDPCASPYYGDFVPSVFQDAAALSDAAGVVLCNILHDYSAFSVSTIDRFFQQTLKAFAREIGHFSSYAIELDRNSLIKESVDRFLDSLTESETHSRSLEWMTRKTLSQLEDGEGFKLEATLRKIAERFNSEEFRVSVESSGTDEAYLYSDERLRLLEEGCDEILGRYSDAVKSSVERISEAFEAAGIDPYDTSRHFMSINLKKYSSIEQGSLIPMISDSFRRNLADVSLWFPKAKKQLEAMVTGQMLRETAAFLQLFDLEYRIYNTAVYLKKQVYGFAIANELYSGFKEILKEKNVLTIDQTNTLLRQIIDGSDTPFIYEKLGVRYDHFLLDEFQDTSQVQWDNFRPLLANSVAAGHDNLIVGDVKQSIYRWRQSDWELLENRVQEDFESSTSVETLATNYRSCPEIVGFNNEYFTAAAEYLGKLYGPGGEVIPEIYSDVRQKVHRQGSGMVEFVYCDREQHYEKILDAVRKALSVGYELGDITVLVRLNKEGSDIARFLIANGIPVVSDDSLKISSSLTVRRLAAILAGIENPDDSMARHLVSMMSIEMPSSWNSLIDLCESLLRTLAQADRKSYEAETLYIQSFMDLVQDYVAAEGNNLRGFLKKWADDRSNISSPKTKDSVRIMTVHKSKGLDFPYVIFPSLDSVEFYSFTNRWSRPDVSDTPLEAFAEGVYDVFLSSKSENTLFSRSYMEERLMQYVDNINILYVAFTRASKAMTVISSLPSGYDPSSGIGMERDAGYNGFSQWSLAFLESDGDRLGFVRKQSDDGSLLFTCGEIEAPGHREDETVQTMRTEFVSWPLNPLPGDDGVAVGERGRLKFSTDALDFFSEEGRTGVSSSKRIRGVVLHDILSRVRVPQELKASVARALAAGELSESEAKEAFVLLSEGISRVADRGWFPENGAEVMNEVTVIDSDGKMYRPDRVVLKDGKVTVIDFKFGNHDIRYERQVRHYAEMWRRMGYSDVSAFLWYVQDDKVIEVI